MHPDTALQTHRLRSRDLVRAADEYRLARAAAGRGPRRRVGRVRYERRLRRLVVDGTAWLWTVRHRHPECREVLSLHREGARATLRLVFRPGPGRYVADGFLHVGAVSSAHGEPLNLHEPGVVRRLLDEATARGLLPVAPGEDRELDGWPLFDALQP